MAYEKLTLAKFLTALNNDNRYETATAARRGVGKSSWSEKEKENAHAAINRKFGSDEKPAAKVKGKPGPKPKAVKAAAAPKAKGKPGPKPKAKAEKQMAEAAKMPVKAKGKPGPKPKAHVAAAVESTRAQLDADLFQPLVINETVQQVQVLAEAVTALSAGVAAISSAKTAAGVQTDELQTVVDLVVEMSKRLNAKVEIMLEVVEPEAPKPTFAAAPVAEAAEAGPEEEEGGGDDGGEGGDEEVAAAEKSNGITPGETVRRRTLFEGTLPPSLAALPRRSTPQKVE